MMQRRWLATQSRFLVDALHVPYLNGPLALFGGFAGWERCHARFGVIYTVVSSVSRSIFPLVEGWEIEENRGPISTDEFATVQLPSSVAGRTLCRSPTDESGISGIRLPGRQDAV